VTEPKPADPLERALDARPETGATGDLPPEAFRQAARELVDWMTGYLEGVERYPVLSRSRPGDLRAALPPSAPETPESLADIFRDFEALVLPGITHWNHPSFHGYFAVTGSAPGILGEMLTATLNVNAMLWRTSPAATELEAHVLGWIRELLGLPEGHFGVIQDTASSSSLVALAAARHRAWPEAREVGLHGLPPGRIYASTEAHSSIDKAALTLGLGLAGVRRVAVDQAFRMDPEALVAAMDEDRAAGVRPLAVVATLGTTSTTSVDPVGVVGEVARSRGAWLHVDAAYAGAAAMVPELRPHFRGWEEADSIVFNPHKWLFTPMDCSILYTRDPETVRAAFSLVPEYLRTPGQGSPGQGSQGRGGRGKDTPGQADTTDLMDYGVALGRRFRALKLWYVLRAFGAEGMRERIREHVRLARLLAGWIDDAAGWERVAPVPFSTVVFRREVPGLDPESLDALNLELMDAVNASGESFLSHTRLRGRIALRVAVGNLRTERRHLERSWELLVEHGERLAAASGSRSGSGLRAP
jgi:aromatic-L-amino-acid/L-tryptophan decarboxylase